MQRFVATQVYGNATQLGITNTSSCYVAALTPVGSTSIRSESFQSGDLCQDPTRFAGLSATAPCPPPPTSWWAADPRQGKLFCRHAFFDTVHPSSAVHAGIARAFLRDIAPLFWGSSQSSTPVASG